MLVSSLAVLSSVVGGKTRIIFQSNLFTVTFASSNLVNCGSIGKDDTCGAGVHLCWTGQLGCVHTRAALSGLPELLLQAYCAAS